jgi:pyrrolidone-carboxylate peptidase
MKTCEVETKFDVSLDQLKDCVDALEEKPVLVIGLGETGCEMKVELMGRNLDRTKGPDNAGEERKNTTIIKGAPEAVGFNYPLPEMYCSLSSGERKEIAISNNAGSFVCNNFAFQTTWSERDLNFGFIHVPSHFCRDVKSKNQKIAMNLLKMIEGGVEKILLSVDRPRLPVTKQELEVLRNETQNNECLKSFYKQARAWDQKTRWSIFRGN